MKKRFLSLSCALLCTLAFSVASAAVPDQPRMQAAKADLETAKSELQRAEHNKGGHRANAIGFVNAAISAVNRGIEFDRRHNHAQPATELFGGAAGAAEQPHMRAALASLQSAKNNLEAATSDKGGYRKNAIALVNKAINEVNRGIAAGN